MPIYDNQISYEDMKKMVPKIGDRVRGNHIGKDHHRIYVFIQCPDCQKTRWVTASTMRDKRLSERRCNPCAMKEWGLRNQGENSINYKGGMINEGGYRLVRLPPDSFYLPMSRSTRYLFEHRLVMAKHLGRNLHLWEIVHHKNGFRDDNRLENLELHTRSGHIQAHGKGYIDGYQQGFADGQNTQVRELKKEIRLLRFQIKEGSKV